MEFYRVQSCSGNECLASQREFYLVISVTGVSLFVFRQDKISSQDLRCKTGMGRNLHSLVLPVNWANKQTIVSFSDNSFLSH